MQQRSKVPTLKDVALAAGVAKMTASVVLNGARSGTQVSEATRARILEAAEQLGYRRNAIARALSRRRMDVLGVAAPCGPNGLQDYFLEVFNGIVLAAARHGQSATVFAMPEWQSSSATPSERLLEICDGRVDGLILLGPHRLDSSLAESIRNHVPLVTVHAADAPAWLYNLDVDNEGGTYAATRHLLELGHRRIAHLPARIEPIENQEAGAQAGAQERFAGYLRALEEAGLPLDPALVPPGDFSEWSGRARTERLLDELTSPAAPTAFCCANDAIALGCLQTLQERGLRVPEDISLTGFDDLRFTQIITPPLTTVRQPFFQIGQRAVELLLAQIAQPEDIGAPSSSPLSHTEVLPVELVIRGSTAAPPATPSCR